MKRLAFVTVALFTTLATLGACVGDIQSDEVGGDETAFALGNPDLRIAVVGAGASGLTAAHTLEKLGYQNVTVFEKEAEVGGKIQSFSLMGVSGELGAVFTSPDYELTLELAQQYGIQYVEYQVPRVILDTDGEKKTFQKFLLDHYSIPELQQSIQNYAFVLSKFASIEADGYANLDPDLALSFDLFADKYGIKPVADLSRSIMTGFGYDFYDRVPAAYIMKLLPWLVKIGPTGFESPPYFVFPGGFQNLWKAVAADLNVRTNAKVTEVKRAGSKIKLTVNGDEELEFDAVIVSAPLNVVPSFVKLTRAEEELFSKVKISRYFVTLFGAAGLQTGETVFIQAHAHSTQENHASVWGNPGGQLPVFIAYQLADATTPGFLVTGQLALDILHLGHGVFAGPIKQKEWEYFPRVDGEAILAGFYDEVEALQGDGGLYYVGSTLSFETVERTARYARTLVKKHFPATAVIAP